MPARAKQFYSRVEKTAEKLGVKPDIIINNTLLLTLKKLEDIQILYTTNKIERLMGEISKRCKHKWMHWSTNGLKNTLTITLVRYTHKLLYQRFKKAYIHNRPFIKRTQHKAIL